MRTWAWAWAIGCSDGPEEGTSGPPTEPSAPVDVCAAEPDLTLTTTASSGASETTLSLSVTASLPATVAARCAADGDPAEVHLAESTAAAAAHTLTFTGLLPSTAYTCTATAVCPASPASATSGWVTGAAPVELGDLVVDRSDADAGGSALGYTLAYVRRWECADGGAPGWIGAWDPRGALRWWWPVESGFSIATEVHLHATEPWVGWGGGDTALGYPQYAAPAMGPTYAGTAIPLGDEAVFSHDFRDLPDGSLLTLAYSPNAVGSHVWKGFSVQRWDPAAEVVTFALDSQELVDSDVLLEPPPGNPEPYHANAIAWDERPEGPFLAVSLCDLQALLGFDVATREVPWVLAAGAGWTVLDADGAPLTDADLPQCAHGIDWVDGELLVYDNGRQRGQSIASQWAIDGEARVARRTWMWTEPGWFEEILGDVEALDADQVFVTQARRDCAEPATAVDVDRATGEVLARTTFPAGAVYRAERVDPCRLFTSARDCGALAARLAALGPAFDR